MKILVVTSMLPQRQPSNAVPLVSYALLKGLTQHHTLTLLTGMEDEPTNTAALYDLQTAGIEVKTALRTEPKGLQRWQRRWRFATMWLKGYPWRTVWFYEPKLQQLINQTLAKQHFDLLVVDDNAAGVYRYHTQTPATLIEHEVRQRRSVEWAQLRPTPALWWALSELDWRRWRNYQRSVWQRFDRIQVFSERDAEAVRALAPKLTGRVHVNPFGVDLPAPARTEREKEGILLFAGGFSHPPNVDAALWLGREIMPLIRQQRHNVHLLLVGSEPPQEVQSLACEDTIVTGRVPEIEAYVEQATVIVAPIRTGGGMRMKVLQGMALGKAVVTTQRGADGLLLDGAAAPLVVAESAAQFAAAVVDLLNDPPRRQALGRQARAFVVQQHSAAAYAGRLEAIYAEMRCADATESWSDQGNSYSAIEPVRGV